MSTSSQAVLGSCQNPNDMYLLCLQHLPLDLGLDPGPWLPSPIGDVGRGLSLTNQAGKPMQEGPVEVCVHLVLTSVRGGLYASAGDKKPSSRRVLEALGHVNSDGCMHHCKKGRVASKLGPATAHQATHQLIDSGLGCSFSQGRHAVGNSWAVQRMRVMQYRNEQA